MIGLGTFPGERRQRAPIPPWVWLTLIYVVSVAVHFLRLRAQAKFPLLATDEVQYIGLGDSIRLGAGFTTRGEVHTALPPLYPLFVAFAHSVGSNARISALFFSCAFISLVVFPAYRLGRLIGLDRLSVYLMAAAAAFLPHTLFAGMYMAETVNYPLFMTAFVAFALWVEQPTWRRAMLGGTCLSLMLLTKLASLSFAVAVLVTVIVVTATLLRRKQTPPRFAWQIVSMCGLVIATQALWQAYKYTSQSAGLGMYGRTLGDYGLPHLTASVFGLYLADLLLAPGLLVAIPLLLWFTQCGRTRFPLAVLLAATIGAQITIHGILLGGLTGELDERLFFYSFPLIAMFAVKGTDSLKGSWMSTRALFILVPLLLLIPIYRAAHYNPVVAVPWVSAVGSFAWVSVDSFSPRHLITGAVGLVLVAGALILLTPRFRVQRVAAVLVFAFFSLTFVSSAREMFALAGSAGYPVSRITSFLSRSNVNANARLIVCANMAYYQEQHLVTPLDQFFINWHRRFDLSDLFVLQIEALGHYDVRIARYPEQIRTWMRPGDHLLSATRMTDLQLVSYQYPYYLYRLTETLHADPKPIYVIDITEELSYLWPLGLPPAQQVYQMLGQPVNLLAGHYRATFFVRPDPSRPFFAEVERTVGKLVLARRQGSASGVTTFDFATPGDSPLQFRLSGPGMLGAVFKAASVEYLRPFVTPLPPAAATGQFVSEPGRPGAIVDPALRLACDFSSINGEGPAPMYTIRRGAPLDFRGEASGPAWKPSGERWIELISSRGKLFYLRTESQGAHSFRAAGSTSALTPDVYTATVAQVEGDHQVSCVNHWRLTITSR
ncbi:MAG: hypothetical protein NTV05_16615 [Acidobacteria bacterium]|nr:hypothetical protein [Acidobacteriota bacterium]